MEGAVAIVAAFEYSPTMTTENREADGMMCCASCGIAAIDDVKLMDCDAGCGLVKYCSDICQEIHREQHDEQCRKRVGELRDKELFTQPDESHLGECPICCLPLSLDLKKSSFMNCCSKTVCLGCGHSNKKRETMEGLEQRCLFCREPLPKSHAEMNKQCMERVMRNDPSAIRVMGKERYNTGDYKSALKFFH